MAAKIVAAVLTAILLTGSNSKVSGVQKEHHCVWDIVVHEVLFRIVCWRIRGSHRDEFSP